MLTDLVKAGKVAEFVDLAPLTTYKVGGPARWLLDAETLTDLESLGPYPDPVVVIGRGSNLVVADEGFPGLVIRLGNGFSQITIGRDRVVAAGANAPLPAVARAAAKAAIGGFSWMVGVPGSVGGAVRMNAGCFGSDTAAMVNTVSVWDLRAGERVERSAGSLDYGYRTSNLAPHEVVIEASFSGSIGDPKDLEKEMRHITRWRRDHQPGGTHNAGSVFKNPVGDAAGRIIDDLGLKGTRVGNVSVSTKHANFFVAEPGATATDIRTLVDLVASTVYDRTGVRLVPEMVFVGFD
ncbi:MAG: UDP-N-acetylmuramate dehydrogenase [Acidimicrobiia bacterium]|nr:UDP-N-acetylmuramate dehydrogenase [Acidimicrobiia bacterium]MDH5422495.1 UDP-N-acetylmuramate dehydrogenase [Acidimicrobiia bacterium]MDH5502781.1 UDP-N-acetylmuramate dehydrogenase [Acidimicrobiia bacterium]